MRDAKPLFSTDRDDWVTPVNVRSVLRKMFDGEIALDPCTTYSNPCGATQIYTVEENGLSCNWKARSVYVNPPYSENLSWCEKAVMEHQVSRADEIVILVPARTDTKWWHRLVVNAHAVAFWRGRLKFLLPDGGEAASSAPFPSALVYLGPRPAHFSHHLSPHGWVVPCGPRRFSPS